MTVSDLQVVLNTFELALTRLGEALAQPKSEWTRDAAIQRFEFTFEQSWKAIARFCELEGMRVASPRQAFRAALRLHWIADDVLWLDMVADRNRTVHAYNEAMAEDIYSHLPAYCEALAALLLCLRSVR